MSSDCKNAATERSSRDGNFAAEELVGCSVDRNVCPFVFEVDAEAGGMTECGVTVSEGVITKGI